MRYNICILFLLLPFIRVSAQYLLTEDFSGFQIGNSVQNAVDPTNLNTGEWISVNESSGSSIPTIIGEPLTFADYGYSGRGKTLSFVSEANGTSDNLLCLSRMHLPYPCQPEGEFIDGSNEFYTAFMINLSATESPIVQEIFSYYELSSNTRRGCVFYKLSADKSKVSFSFQKRPDVPSSQWTKEYDKSKTMLLVVKYGHVCVNEKNLGHAEFELFINPNPLKTEEENNSVKIYAHGNDSGYDTDLRYVNFRQSGHTAMKIAGICIANSYRQVFFGSESSLENLPPGDTLELAVVGKTVFFNKEMAGKLSIYDINSRLVRSYDMQGKMSIKTNLEPGIYILIYKESGENRIQTISIQS